MGSIPGRSRNSVRVPRRLLHVLLYSVEKTTWTSLRGQEYVEKTTWRNPTWTGVRGEAYVDRTTRTELGERPGIEPTTFSLWRQAPYPLDHRGSALREAKGPAHASETLLLLLMLLLLLLLLLPRLVLLHCLLLLHAAACCCMLLLLLRSLAPLVSSICLMSTAVWLLATTWAAVFMPPWVSRRYLFRSIGALHWLRCNLSCFFEASRWLVVWFW